MNRPLLLAALTLLTAPLLVSGEQRGTEIAFSVESGTSLSKTYVTGVEVALDDFSMTMNGQELPMTPEMVIDIHEMLEIEVEDTYSKVADGRPTLLTRSFDTLSHEMEMHMESSMNGEEIMNEDMAPEISSVLEGESVEFVWNEDEETYDIVLPDGSPLEEEDIEGLIEDMDYRALLPTEEVDEGDEWEIELGHLEGVLAAGGDFKLIPDDPEALGGAGSGDLGNLSDFFNEEVEGEFLAVFDGIREIDDVEVAVIEISFELTNVVDLTDKYRDIFKNLEFPGVDEVDPEHVEMEITYEGEGLLIWNLKAGHFHSFETSGDFEMIQEQGMLLEVAGQEMSMEQHMEFSGTLSIEVSVE